MKTNATNIIILALIYKYLSTGETKLNVWDIERFRININCTLYEQNGKIAIESENSIIDEIFYLDEKYNYVLKEPIDLDYICKHFIDTLPQEVLLESLKQEHLDFISAKQDKIKISKVTTYETRDMQIYSMSEKSACASARKALTYEGAKNINVRGAFYLGMKPDHLWNVTASYAKDIIYLDFPGIIKYSDRIIGGKRITYKNQFQLNDSYLPAPHDVLKVEFNENDLNTKEITKRTRKVRAFIYNPLTDEAIIVHYAGLYMLPGGKVDKDEDRLTALIREIKEETGIEITEQDITPYLVIDSYDKHYFDRKDGIVNRHTETVFYKIETTASIDDTKKQLTDSEIDKNHSVTYVPLHNMKNLVETNETINNKRKQFDREILLAINEFINTLGTPSEEHKLLYKHTK